MSTRLRMTPEEIIARRARQRARLRRSRIIAVVVIVACLVVAGTFAVLAVKRLGERPPGSSAAAKPVAESPKPSPSSSAATASPSETPSPSPSPSKTQAAEGPAPKPPITEDYIDFSAQRQAEMADYCRAHYGAGEIEIDPKVIVLHYTAGGSYAAAHATFASDAPNMGVKPGVVAQFVIDKDGTIYQQLPLAYMGRHTVGLNYAAIGIECVQEYRSSDAATVGEILGRKRQADSLVALVRWLMHRYDISLPNVIGHGMANDSPYFKDLKGWNNDHIDWSQPQVARFRATVKAAQ